MRTTLTLDDDVAVLLRRLRKDGRGGLKQLINEGLRRGLAAMNAPSPRKKPYRIRPVSLGRCLVGSLDDVAGVLAAVEGDRHK